MTKSIEDAAEPTLALPPVINLSKVGAKAPASPPTTFPRPPESGGAGREAVEGSQRVLADPPVQLDAFPDLDDEQPAASSRLELLPTDKPAVVLVDPFAIEPEPFNGRGIGSFDPERHRALIDDMRVRGNTVAVRLRPRADGKGWTCPSGSRRVNAARLIAADRPGFRVAAIIDEAMTDAQAYALCLADNHGRSEVTPLQRGREIRWAIEYLHDGDRQAYIDHHKVDKSVVSRALELVGLPDQIVACAQDPEALPTLFAEKLAPRLKDRNERRTVIARAKALGDERLPAPRLLRYLLSGERGAATPDRREVKFGTGRDSVRATVTVAPDRSATLKLPSPDQLTDQQKVELSAFLREQSAELLIGLSTQKTVV